MITKHSLNEIHTYASINNTKNTTIVTFNNFYKQQGILCYSVRFTCWYWHLMILCLNNCFRALTLYSSSHTKLRVVCSFYQTFFFDETFHQTLARCTRNIYANNTNNVKMFTAEHSFQTCVLMSMFHVELWPAARLCGGVGICAVNYSKLKEPGRDSL